jgi:hypothetical protein
MSARRRYRERRRVMGRYDGARVTLGAAGLTRGEMVPALNPGGQAPVVPMEVKRRARSGAQQSSPTRQREKGMPSRPGEEAGVELRRAARTSA